MYVSFNNKPATPRPSARPQRPGTTGARPGSKRPKLPRAVLMLGFTSLFTDISSEMVVAVLPVFLTLQLGMTPAQFGLVDGLYRGVSAVSRLAAGVLSDRLGRPKLIASIGYGLSAATRPLLLLASTVASVATLISVDRIGKGVRTAPRDAMIAGASRPRDLGYNFGVHRAMDNIGAMLGPLVAFCVLTLVPGRFDAVFVVSTAFALVGLAVLLLFVPERGRSLAPRKTAGQGCKSSLESEQTPCPRWGTALRCRTCGSTTPSPTDHGPRRLTGRDLAQLFRSRSFVVRVGLAGLLTVFTVSDAFLFLALLERDKDLASVFPLFAVGLGLAYAVLAIPVGRLADRWGRMRVYLAGHVVLLVAYLLAAGPLGTVPAAVGTLLLMGLFYAATDGVLSASVAATLPQVSRASGLALAQTVVAACALVSSVAFGLMLGWLGAETAFVVMGLGMVVAVVVSTLLLRREPVSEEVS